MTLDSSSPGKKPVVRRLLAFSWRYRWQVTGVFLLQALLLVLTLGGLGFTGLAVDVIRHALAPSTPAPGWPLRYAPPAHWSPLAVLMSLGLSVLAMAALRGALTFAYELASGNLIHVRIVPSLRAELFERLQRSSFRFFDAHPTGSIINRLTRDVQMLRAFVDGVVIQGAILALSLAVFLTYMLATHVRLTLVSVLSTPLLFWVTRVFSRWADSAYEENRRLSDGMVRSLAEGILGIVVTKVFGREREQLGRFEEANRAVRDQQRAIFRNVSRYTPGVDFLTQLNLAVLLLYGAHLVIARELSLGELVVFAGLLQQFAARASAMATVVNTLQQSLSAARRVFEVLDAEPEVRSAPDAVVVSNSRGEVAFEGVDFEYAPGAGALRQIDLHVPAGTRVGIFGATGAGKSTLLSLIPRFYDPTAGRVLLDGIDLRCLDLRSLRGCMGMVFQETFLFRDTVAANIAFAEPGATMSQIEAAAKAAGAHAFIERLPAGYETVLQEGAVNLSGGQRQRLAIARALLLQPPVLVLDDPTAAVDAETEAEVLEAVGHVSKGRTTFIVSNRLSALRRVDRVVVLGAGQIVEQGTAEELLASDGPYAAAARLQAPLQADLDALEVSA